MSHVTPYYMVRVIWDIISIMKLFENTNNYVWLVLRVILITFNITGYENINLVNIVTHNTPI